ncbi:MAG: MATE family efflux transporter [Faecalibacterium sp.]|nr:MATE family efflux transporter [Faecalibacterium sp.]
MRNMTQGPIRGHLLSYAVPLILGNLFQLTYNAVDSVVIGRFAGEDALAAVGAANPVMTIAVLGVSGLCMGASVLCSQFFGAGDLAAVKRETATALLAGAVLSAAVLIFGLAFTGPILQAINVPPEIFSMAGLYLRIIFCGFPFTFLYNALSAFLRSVGDSKTPVRYLAAASVLNVVLDVAFVWGLHWGVMGAAVATVIAQITSALLCAAHIYRKVPVLQLKPEDLRIDRELLGKTVASGGITALQQSCQPIGKVFIQSVINAQGVSMIAAFNAVTRVDDFACIPEQSISHGMMTCVAQNRGAGRHDRVHATLRTGLGLEVSYWVCICAATLLLKTPIMRLFAADEAAGMLQMGVDYLTIMAFLYLLPGLTNGMQGFFRGMGQMSVTLFCTALQISIRAVVVFVLVPRIGLTGAAWACMAGWGAMLAFEVPYYFWCRKHKWMTIEQEQ